MLRLRADDSLFIVSETTIKKFPNSAFAKVYMSDYHHPLIKKENVSDNVTLYIDIDPLSLKDIVYAIRYNTLESLSGRVLEDAIKMNFIKDDPKDNIENDVVNCIQLAIHKSEIPASIKQSKPKRTQIDS
jgi:hypothetical protein